jgi:hypothetical protein
MARLGVTGDRLRQYLSGPSCLAGLTALLRAQATNPPSNHPVLAMRRDPDHHATGSSVSPPVNTSGRNVNSSTPTASRIVGNREASWEITVCSSIRASGAPMHYRAPWPKARWPAAGLSHIDTPDVWWTPRESTTTRSTAPMRAMQQESSETMLANCSIWQIQTRHIRCGPSRAPAALRA